MANRFRPLWKKKIPKYPLYWKGDPQLRILLPQFWMKIINPRKKVPPSIVHFEVHPQMSRLDIKQYLEKIYKVPVLRVNTEIRQGLHYYGEHPEPDYGEMEEQGIMALSKEDDRKYAYVVLGEGQTFEYPKDLLKEAGTTSNENVEKYKETKKGTEQKLADEWDKSGIPPWFR